MSAHQDRVLQSRINQSIRSTKNSIDVLDAKITAGSDASLSIATQLGIYAYDDTSGSESWTRISCDPSGYLDVRAVTVGEQPTGTYSNVKVDGHAFRTTDPLAGSTLTVSMTDTLPAVITLTDATSFGVNGGYIYIGSEFIEYSDKSGNDLTIATRGAFGTDASGHNISDTVGEAYNSGVLLLDGYTQIATKYNSSNTGQLRFQWSTDLSGDNVIRTLAPTYSVADTYDFLSTPNFAPYVRYVWGNTEPTDTSNFYFETEFYTKPVSAQVLTLDSTVFGTMTANLGRNVIEGKTDAGSYMTAGITADGELLTNTRASTRQRQANYVSGIITSDTYVVLVDLSSEDYTNYVNLDNLAVTCNFSSNNSDALVKVGVITRIDGTDADISYLVSIPFSAANANTFVNFVNNYQPSSKRFEVSGGVLTHAATNDVQTSVVAVNTGITLSSPKGSVTPAVGDVVVFFDRVANDFSSNVSCVYHTD